MASTTLTKMFSLSDRQMRLNLLSNLQLFVGFFNNKVINESIYPQVVVLSTNFKVTGFNDSVPLLREATVKSMLNFADKLNQKTLSTDTLKYLSKSAMDPEPGIRTNSVICLGMIAKYFDDYVSLFY